MLITAPVIQALTATDVASFVVTLVTADYAGHAEAGSNMQKVTRCQIVKTVDFRLIDTTDPPAPPVVRYFNRLRDAVDEGC